MRLTGCEVNHFWQVCCQRLV